jgi:hypothetical protein
VHLRGPTLQREDKALTAPPPPWSNRRATSLQLLRGAQIATSLQPQSLFGQPARDYYTLDSAFSLRAAARCARCSILGAVGAATGILFGTPKLRTNGTPFPLSRQIVKQFSPPITRSRDKANETRNDSTSKTQETNHSAGRESVSQLSEPWDGCRIVPALRVENRFWQKEVPAQR